jgi:hypothetical protein
MATSETVPLVKVKTMVRVLPSITVRLLVSITRVTPSARLIDGKRESGKGDQCADNDMLFFHEDPPGH